MSRILRCSALAVGLVLALPLAAVHLLLRGSLPRLEGRVATASLVAPVTLERDALGIVTVTASSRNDLAFGTGFAQGQDRFFEMDLSRRLAAGELSELFGAAALDQDRRARLFRFRHVAQRALQAATPEQRAVLEAYARGVNAGMASLASRPWEYWLLRSRPAPWRPEDTLLVVHAMWWQLQYGDLRRERLRRTINQKLGGPECAEGWKCALAFLYPPYTRWDSPNVEDEAALRAADARVSQPQPVPAANALDVRSGSPSPRAALRRTGPAKAGDEAVLAEYLESSELRDIGSNNWALAGGRTASGAALVASDMHLGLRVPTIWYRMRLRLVAPGAARPELDVNGVTLPGAPLVVAGSNGHVAWSFTNSDGFWSDTRPEECLGLEGSTMHTAAGGAALTTVDETIHVRGRADAVLAVHTSEAGVLLEHDPVEHRCWFAHWLAMVPAATNLNLLSIERATSVQEVLALAPELGIPHQNLIAGDAAGHIGWTVAGRLPLAEGADRAAGPTGWRTAANAPHLADPPIAMLWSANSRPSEGAEDLAAIGGAEASLGAGYMLGARARQIRDALRALPRRATPADMLRIQLDDRAVFLSRWRDLLLGLTDAEALAGSPSRGEFRRLVAGWEARASTDSVGYRLVRTYRDRVADEVWQSILRALEVTSDEPPPAQFEQPLWTLVSERPLHMLAPEHESWRAFLLSQLDRVASELAAECGALARCNWGSGRAVRIRHPLSGALPLISPLLDMPPFELPGDHDMPRVQDGAFGASERFAVAPGHEAEGYLDIAGGQSGHPLSPYYRAGFREWARGEPLPFLPGPPRHRLVLQP